jgi:hypothetical protein
VFYRLTEEMLISNQENIQQLIFDRLAPLLVLKTLALCAFQHSESTEISVTSSSNNTNPLRPDTPSQIMIDTRVPLFRDAVNLLLER